MAISIDEATKVISVDQADLTFVSGTLYELDTNLFRTTVGGLLDDTRYVWMDPAFNHNGEVTVAGTTFARTIELINGYSVTFENLAYTVRLAGSNNNFFDVDGGILNPSALVTVIGQNSAGLVVGGSALTGAQSTQLDEIHQDMGLDSGAPVTVSENTADTSYDQTSTGITKQIRTSGSDKTVTRV